jgi:phosphoserine phosphatase
VVDLDGGLLARDPVADVLGWGSRHQPVATAHVRWKAPGRPDLAAGKLARLYPMARLSLRVNGEILDLIAAHRRCGGDVTLVSAAPADMVDAVAQTLGLTVWVYGSDRDGRFTPERRALALAGLFGRRGFDYAGGRADQAPICHAARRALMVEGEAGLRAELRTAGGALVRLGPPVWQGIEMSLRDLAGATVAPDSVPSINRRLSAAIWAAAGTPVTPVADPDDWEAEPQSGGRPAGPERRQGRRLRGR